MISQRPLGTEEIILIHHTDCGMETFTDDAVKDQILEDTGLRPSFSLETFPKAVADVKQTAARIKASPFVPKKIVRGFVYEVEWDGSERSISTRAAPRLAAPATSRVPASPCVCGRICGRVSLGKGQLTKDLSVPFVNEGGLWKVTYTVRTASPAELPHAPSSPHAPNARPTTLRLAPTAAPPLLAARRTRRVRSSPHRRGLPLRRRREPPNGRGHRGRDVRARSRNRR